MNTNFRKLDIILAFVALCSILFFIQSYQGLFPEASIDLEKNKNEIKSISYKLIEEYGYSLEDYRPKIDLRHSGDELQYLERSFDTQTANDLMRDSINVFFWNIEWKKGKVSHVTLSNESIDSDIESKDVWYDMRLDLRGNPVSFRRMIDDKAKPDSLIIITSNEALKIADTFIGSNFDSLASQWSYVKEKEDLNSVKGKYSFTYRNINPIANQELTIHVNIAQGKIISYKQEYNSPDSYHEYKENDEIYEIVSFVIVYLLFIILGSIFFVKRLRADLLDMKSGVIPGIIVFVGFCLSFFLPHIGSRLWEVLVGFLIAVPFVTGALWVAFVLGESYTREIWPEKLQTIDLLRRNLLFPQLGRSILRGIVLCCIILGVVSVYYRFVTQYFDVYFTFGEASINYWASPAPSLYALGTGLLNSFYIVVTYCLFFFSFVRRKIKISWLFVGLMALFFAFVSLPLPKLLPHPVSLIGNVLVGLVIISFYLKYDFLTVSIGTILLPVSFYGLASLFSQSPFLIVQSGILFCFLIAVLTIAIISLRRKNSVSTEVVYVPDYVQRIYERERIHRELEIARNVQINFLPNQTPSLDFLDVASICLPAREVGGDYFDFIELGPKKLGVAIGDVSGKGISAAFYMTLTKGFLRSQARTAVSPRQVLIHMNELFYENADRDMFISMIYAIFDLEARTITVARAGHNPLILKRLDDSLSQDITPNGLALGLESGELFARTLEEHTITLCPGDCYFFYTDGFNEAQNRFKEEFGEERLRQVIEETGGESAENMLIHVQNKVTQFIGNAMQHDDMTAVIVKIQDK